MKKFLHPVVIVCMTVITTVFMLCTTAWGQNVVRKGNTFVEQKNDTQHSGAEFSGYFYESSDSKDSIFVSKNGKAFIWKVSKNTGKKYRKYLPKVTEQLKDEKR